MIHEELNAIRERAEKASSGRWLCTLLDHEARTYVIGAFNSPMTIVGDINKLEDAEFITHAREDITALLAEVERLNGVVGTLISHLELIEEANEYASGHIATEAIKYASEEIR